LNEGLPKPANHAQRPPEATEVIENQHREHLAQASAEERRAPEQLSL
jgi:hypothetical protein